MATNRVTNQDFTIEDILDIPMPTGSKQAAPTPKTFQQRADVLLALGIPIIPLHAKSKEPCTAHAALDGTTDSDTIDRWIDQYPAAGNCAACASFKTADGRDGFWFQDDDMGTLAATYKTATGYDLPSTFTVKTSRGFHFYFQHDDASRAARYGSKENASIDIPGYKGEARCNHEYVVGPGSVHPSGAVYEIYNDAPIVAAPAPLLAWLQTSFALSESLKGRSAKMQRDRKADPGFNKLCDAVRWKPLLDRLNQHADARFHNPVLKPGGLMYCPMPGHYKPEHKDIAFSSTPFGVLKDAAIVHCFGCDFSGDMVAAVYALDGGKNKYQNMYDCARAICKEEGLKFEEFFPANPTETRDKQNAEDRIESGGSPPSSRDVEEYESATTVVSAYPQMGNDLISQYARTLTQGTGIPFGHARECLKNFLAFCLSDATHYPNHEKLYVRGWHFNLGEPETGKTTALTEIMDRWSSVLIDLGIWVDKLSSYGSLQYLTKGFEDHERMLLYVTEGNTLANANEHIPAIFGGLSDLYDQPVISAGSYRNKSAKCVKAKGSCVVCVTPDDFIKAMQGKGVIGGGVLPRWTMSYSEKVIVEGDWSARDEKVLRILQERIKDRFTGVTVVETEEAKVIRLTLTREMERPEVGRHGKRLIEHFKRECLLAAVFAGNTTVGEISKEIAEWAAIWTRYQMHLRIVYWPIDAGNDVERMCSAMRALLKRAHPKGVSLKNLKDAANVYRDGSGGIETFGRAYRAMMQNEEMRKVGRNSKGKDLFGLVAD